MTSQSHKVLTFSIVTALTGNIVAGLLSSFGAVIPDIIEEFDPEKMKHDKNQFIKWIKIHRKISHWPVLYSIAFCISFTIYLIQKNIICYISNYLLIGCLFHIIEDAMSGKVPLCSAGKRSFGIRFIKTGSWIEHLFTGTTSVFLLYLSKERIIESLRSLSILIGQHLKNP